MGWEDNTKDLIVTKDTRDINSILANSASKMRSNAVFKGLDLVCEGEIEGLVNGSKSVYLDGVVLQNSDDSYNFENVTLSTRYGTADQTYIKDFNQVETPVTAGMPVELISNYPASPSYIVKTITDTNVDAVRIRVGLDSLFRIKNNGDIKSATCDVRVDVQVDGGGYVSAIGGVGTDGAFYFSGKSKTNYERSVTIDLRSFGTAVTSYDIRVYRVSPDSDDVAEPNNTMNKSFLMGYTEIIRVKLTYPYCAVFGIECDAKSMGGKIPERMYHLRGRKIRVPSNYTPYIAATYGDGNTFTVAGNQTSIFTAGATFSCNCGTDGYKACIVLNSSYSSVTTVNVTSASDVITSNLVSAERIYTGTWDGTFQVVKKWSSNSAWVYYDVLSEPLACAGINAAYIDKWTLYNIGRYCDVLVEDGFGKKEPRFSFNGIIESNYDAQELFNVLAASFNAMPYWGTAIATASQDKPTSATRLYTNANVIDGEFFYDGIGIRDINTAAVVVWNNPNDLGKPEPEYVPYNYGIRRYGYKEKRISTLGCNSKGQAHRIGKWILDSEVFKPDNVRFRASFDSIDLMPGEVIKIADQYYGDKRFGFRISKTFIVNTEIIAAVDFTKEIGETYSLHAVIRDSDDNAAVETRAITAAESWPSKLGSELVTNGDMELNSDWVIFNGASSVEQSVEQVYDGTYSWKAVCSGTYQGIHLDTNFTVTSGVTYLISFFIYPVSDTDCHVLWHHGDHSSGDEFGWTNLTQGAWNYCETKVTETISGANAAVSVTNGNSSSNIYVDNVSVKEVVEETFTKLTIASAFSRDPVADESGIISQANDSEDNVREFKVVAVEESEKNIFEVAGVEYDSTKYARIESDLEFVEETPPSIDFTISPPTNLDLTEFTYVEGQNHLFGINVGWTMAADPRVMYYTVQFDKSSSDDTDPIDYITVALIPDPFFQIKPLDVSGSGTLTYSVRVRSEALIGHSAWVEDSVVLSLDPDAPPDVTGLQVKGGGTVFTGLDCEIEWDDMSSGVTNPRHNQYRVDVYYGAVFLRTEYVKINSFIYTFGMNNEDNLGSPHDDLIFYVRCSDIYGVLSEGSVPLTVSNSNPTNPQNLISTSWSLSVEFSWDANTEVDFSHYKYRAKAGSALNGESWYTVVSPHYTRLLTSAEKDSYGTSAAIYFEAIAVDVFGNESSVSSTNDTAASLNILPTDIITFGPTASKLFPYSPVISGLTVTNNSPSAGYIAWSEFTIWHNSIEYTIAAGNTNLFYVYWKDLASTLSTSAESSNPLDISGWTVLEDSVMFINESGIHQKAWGNALVNQIIGSAQIMNLAVNDAHIEELSGTKINIQSSIAIKSATFGADGIQLQYNAGNPRFYAGDGSSKYIKFDGTDVTLGPQVSFGINSASWQASGIQLQYNGGSPRAYIGNGASVYMQYTAGALSISGGDIDILSGGSLSVASGGGISIAGGGSLSVASGGGIDISTGGDMTLTPHSSSPSKIIFAGVAGVNNIEIKRFLGDSLEISPAVNSTGVLKFGTSSYKFANIYAYVDEFIGLYSTLGADSAYVGLQPGSVSITASGTVGIAADSTDLNSLLDVGNDPGDSTFLVDFRNTRSTTNPYGLHIDHANYAGIAGYFLYCENSSEAKFYVQGSGTCKNQTGTYDTISSELRFKENIIDFPSVLDNVKKLKVRNFNFKTNKEDKRIGLIVEEVEPIFPELITEDDGLRSYGQMQLIYILIKALQELNDKVEKIEEK